jgi:hypothetical protein
MSVWVCLDCSSKECTTQSHAWCEAELVEREDGSEAWLWEPEPAQVPHPWALAEKVDTVSIRHLPWPPLCYLG